MQSILEYVVAGDLDARGLAFHALLARDPLTWHPLARVAVDLHISYTWGLAISAQLESLGLAVTRVTGVQVHVRLSGRESVKQPAPVTRPEASAPSSAADSPAPESIAPHRPSDMLRALVESMGPGRVAGSRKSAAARSRRRTAEARVTPAADGSREQAIAEGWVLFGEDKTPSANSDSRPAPAVAVSVNGDAPLASEPLAPNGEPAPLAGARASGAPEEEDLKTSSSGNFRKGESEGDGLTDVQRERANWLLRQRVCQDTIALSGASPEQIGRAVGLYFADPRVARGEIECPHYLLRAKIEIVTAGDRAAEDSVLCREAQAAEGSVREAALLEECARANAQTPVSCLAQQLRDVAAGFAFCRPAEDDLMALARRYGCDDEPVAQSPDEIRAQIRAMLRKAS